MKISEQTNELFTALSKMQSELETASKAKQGHGYKYADLAECINTAKEPLKNNGLAVTQMMGHIDGGTTLITMLTHSSGQYISSEFIMEKAVLMGGAGKNPAQAMGASITYMRRYAFAAIIGLSQEDDDAKNVRQPSQDGQKVQPSVQNQHYVVEKVQEHFPESVELADSKQVQRIQILVKEVAPNLDKAARIKRLNGWLVNVFPDAKAVESTKELTKQQAAQFINALQKQKEGMNNG